MGRKELESRATCGTQAKSTMATFLDGSRYPSLMAAVESCALPDVRYHVTVLGASIDESNALIYAVSRDFQDIVSFLISCGADVRAIDAMGTTALHYAARLNNIAIMKELVNAGARASAIDKAGLAPLHLASLYGWHESVDFLLKAGADPMACTPLGITPISLALKALLRRTKGLFTSDTKFHDILDFRFDHKVMVSELGITDPAILKIATNPQVKRLQRVCQLLETSVRDHGRSMQLQ